MKALRSHAPGGPDTLTMDTLPLPQPGPGEVRIKIEAAGVNFPDTLIIRDLYQIKPPRPFAPGGEIAGTIEAVGDGVTLPLGTRVLALTLSGGFATHVIQRADRVVPIPDAMPFDEAACFLLTYGTTYYGLHDCGGLAPDQTVLILGAAGGVGVAAIEIAKAAGARVIAATSSQAKAEFCREIGADDTLIYPREMDKAAQKELSAQIKSLAPGGTDIVYDPVGGDYAEPALRSMGWMGRYLVIGFTAGIPKIPANLMLLKNCAMQGVFWGAFTHRDPARFAEHLREMFELYARGAIKPRISHRFPLTQGADALRLLETRQAQGKIVLTTDGQ